MEKLEVPIRIYSEANMCEHWRKTHNRKKGQEKSIRLFWKLSGLKIKPPIEIKLIRVAPRTLDYDNLVSGLKKARDTIADLIIPGLQPGRADDNHGIEFTYGQRKGKQNEYKLEVEFYSSLKEYSSNSSSST